MESSLKVNEQNRLNSSTFVHLFELLMMMRFAVSVFFDGHSYIHNVPQSLRTNTLF